jgi:hypothetical protein
MDNYHGHVGHLYVGQIQILEEACWAWATQRGENIINNAFLRYEHALGRTWIFPLSFRHY